MEGRTDPDGVALRVLQSLVAIEAADTEGRVADVETEGVVLFLGVILFRGILVAFPLPLPFALLKQTNLTRVVALRRSFD